MKRFIFILGMSKAIFGSAQPGNSIPPPYPAIDGHLLWIEEKRATIDRMDLDVFEMTDSSIMQIEIRVSRYETLEIEQINEPRITHDLVYVQDGEIYKITKESHTFHYEQGHLIRSYYLCQHLTAMGLCGGLITTAQTYMYWKGDFAYKTIDSHQVRHPCACYSSIKYGYRIAMELYEHAENLLMLEEIRKNK
jgi:hypothetical protein